MGYSTPRGLDPVVSALIKRKARRLAGTCGFTRSDVPDLEQELSMQFCLAAPRFDAARGRATENYERVLARKVRSIVRAATAECRDYRRHGLLLDTGHEPVAQERPSDLRIDLSDALAALSPPDHNVAALLMAGHTVADVGRALGSSRQRVRTACTRAGRRLTAAGVKP
jgi:DNA-directed RNA polymerase specialized sigma24 family protein